MPRPAASSQRQSKAVGQVGRRKPTRSPSTGREIKQRKKPRWKRARDSLDLKMALEGGILPKPATNGLGSCNLQTSGRAGGWHTKSPRPFFALPQFGVMRPFKARNGGTVFGHPCHRRHRGSEINRLGMRRAPKNKARDFYGANAARMRSRATSPGSPPVVEAIPKFSISSVPEQDRESERPCLRVISPPRAGRTRHRPIRSLGLLFSAWPESPRSSRP